MTTYWKPNSEWTGETVAVLAGGPSLTMEAAEALRGHHCIAVNWACQLAPWAEMLLAADGGWPREWREFAGLRVTATEADDLDALYIGHRCECVTLAAGHVVDIRNSGLLAIRVAAEMGAARIILAGFEPELVPDYIGLAEGLQALVAQLQAAGIQVERA